MKEALLSKPSVFFIRMYRVTSCNTAFFIVTDVIFQNSFSIYTFYKTYLFVANAQNLALYLTNLNVLHTHRISINDSDT